MLKVVLCEFSFYHRVHALNQLSIVMQLDFHVQVCNFVSLHAKYILNIMTIVSHKLFCFVLFFLT